MRRFALGAFLALACAAPEESNLVIKEMPIVGGALEPGFPAVGLVTAQGAICTGTLIAPDIVLTAAHCISSANQMAFNFTNPNDGTTIELTFPAKQVFASSQFDESDLGGGHDIGAVILESEVPDTVASPMPILEEGMDLTFIGQSFTAVGYGISNPEAGDGSGTKRSVTMAIGNVTDLLFSYGDSTQNICQGDSGGPDIMNINGVDTVIGVHSFGATGCRGVSASTRVDAEFLNFIKPILNGQSPINPGSCEEDNVCTSSCGVADPDCRCRSNGFCEENCPGGRVDPDCCNEDDSCNTACASGGFLDLDCAEGGGCAIVQENQTTQPAHWIIAMLSACLLFVLRRRD